MDTRRPPPNPERGPTSLIVAVISARDEEKVLGETLDSLRAQTVPIAEIIVVDDGSQDGTASIAEDAGCKIISLPYHSESYHGTPEFAEVWNRGFLEALKFAPQYIFVSGADQVYPPDYVETCLGELDAKTVIVSGRIADQPYHPTSPRGSGRIIDVGVWRRVSECRYPVCYAWEDYLVYKVRELGFETKSISTLVSQGRELARTRYATTTGRAMKELGYTLPHALARFAIMFSRSSPRVACSMLYGYAVHRGRLDCFNYVRKTQRKQLISRIWNYRRDSK